MAVRSTSEAVYESLNFEWGSSDAETELTFCMGNNEIRQLDKPKISDKGLLPS